MTRPLSYARQKHRSLRRMLRRQLSSRRLVLELQVLHEIGRAINEALDLDEVLHTIYVQTGRLMETRYFFIALYDATHDIIDFPFAIEEGEHVIYPPRTWSNGITEWVITHHIPIRLNSNDPNMVASPIMISAQTHAMLAVPIAVGDNVFGVLSVQSISRDNAYTARDEFILTMIADQAAVAIANARRYEEINSELSQRVAQLETLEILMRDLNASLDTNVILEHLVQRVCSTTKADAAMVCLMSDNGQALHVKAMVGFPESLNVNKATAWSVTKGIMGKVARTGLPEWTPDIRISSDFINSRPTTLSQITVPIRHHAKTLGVLTVESDRLYAFNQDMMRFLCQVADHAAQSIYNAQQHQHTVNQQRVIEQRSQQLTEVLRISQALSANLNLDALLPEIVQAVQNSLGFNIALLSMLDQHDPTKMRRRAAVGIPEEQWKILQNQLVDMSWYANVMREEFRISRSYYIPHSHHDSQSIWDVGDDKYMPDLGERDINEWHPADGLFVPLYDSDGKFISVLSVDDPCDRRKPSLESIQVLEIFATQAAIAIENAATYSRSQHLAITDGLTGLYNQRYFTTMLEREVAFAIRYNYPLSLLTADIDFFKRYNDTFGHLVGNILLRDFANLLIAHVRDVDIVSRNGGEEFTIILPKTDIVGAALLAERLRRITAEYPFLHSHITISIGVATLEPFMDGETLHHLADKALYDAKNNGRNQICVSQQRFE